MTSPARPIRAVIFDLDDTLFDDSSCTRAGLAGLSAAHPPLARLHPDELFTRHAQAIAAHEDDVYARRITPQQARVRRFERLLSGAGVEQPDGEAATVAYRAAYRAAWALNGGALELLSALRARGLKVGVLTNYAREVQEEKVARLGLTPYVDALITYDETPPKPDPRSYAAVCRALGVQPDEAVMVGDHWRNDVSGAVAAGLRAVWYDPQGRPAPEDLPHRTLTGFLPTAAALAVLLG